MRALLAAILLCPLAAPTVHAREGAQWAQSDVQVRDWYQSLMQPDNPYLSCCGEADAFEADSFAVEGDHYVAIITDGKGVIAPGTRIPVPNQKMKWDRGNPTGHGIVFIGSSGQVYCYVAPGGGVMSYILVLWVGSQLVFGDGIGISFETAIDCKVAAAISVALLPSPARATCTDSDGMPVSEVTR